MIHVQRYSSVLKQLSTPSRMANFGKRKLATLPKLPVPPLHETLAKYLLSVRPLLDEQDFSKTEKIVRSFVEPGGIGAKLHTMLQDRANHHVNWLADWWLKCAYLEFREPVVAYSSPGLVMPEQAFKCKEDQLVFTTKLITAALNFKKLIDNDNLPEETAGGASLDMSQYGKIFGTCRVPKIPSDELVHNPGSKHIIVAHNNSFFKLDICTQGGSPLPEGQLLKQLKSVIENSQTENDAIGLLTSEHRDSWAKAYKRLCNEPQNKASVEDIQNSLFLVCLDKRVYRSGNYLTHTALQTIHGGGRSVNSSNRWYDKTIQFIIGEDGTVGITYEHSPAEGPPITSLVDYIMLYVDKMKKIPILPSDETVVPCKPLPFKVSSEIKTDIDQADRDLNALIRDLDINCFTFSPFGKDFIKSQKLSPDSVIQMSMQLAFYRTNNNRLGATYESASTRKFQFGRTETIRSASIEALAFCEAMRDKSLQASEKAHTLRQAVTSHKAYTSAANDGLGVDRLLLGLKRTAVENGMNVPDLYMDAGFTTSSMFRLSTSQVPARCDALMGYGPAVPNGYGCCYNPHPKSINFAVSAWNSSPDTHADRFASAIKQGLVDIHDVLVAAQSSKL